MLIKDYALRIVRSDCNASALTVNALGELQEDIGDLLPYLNTVLKGQQYHHEEKILTVKWKGHLITFRPRQIAVTKLEDESEALSVMEELKSIINDVQARKADIEPTAAARPRPRPLDIFKLLPGTNCQECGEAACLAFAIKLVNDEAAPRQCPRLSKPEFAENHRKLLVML